MSILRNTVVLRNAALGALVVLALFECNGFIAVCFGINGDFCKENRSNMLHTKLVHSLCRCTRPIHGHVHVRGHGRVHDRIHRPSCTLKTKLSCFEDYISTRITQLTHTYHHNLELKSQLWNTVNRTSFGVLRYFLELKNSLTFRDCIPLSWHWHSSDLLVIPCRFQVFHISGDWSHQLKWKTSERELTHSSRTKNRQADSSSLPVDMRSSSRPGVPTTMSI